MMSLPTVPEFVLNGPRESWAYGRGPVHVVNAETMAAALIRHSKEYARQDQWDENDQPKPVPAVALIWGRDGEPPAILLLDTAMIVKEGSLMTLQFDPAYREPCAGQ